MPFPPFVPISIIPPVSEGVGPIVWRNGSQINRLTTPLNPSFLVYDGSITRWGDGSAQAPVYLPNIQEVNSPLVAYVAGITSTGQLVKTFGVSNIAGGSAGSVVYQTAPSATGFTAVGTTGQLLSSNGASEPTWINQLSITAGNLSGNINGAPIPLNKVAIGTNSSRQIIDATDNILKIPQVINNQTGTTYTFNINDAGSFVTFNNASPVTITIPLNSSVAFVAGQTIDLIALGTGICQIVGSFGVTLISANGSYLRTQYSGATLIYLGSNVWSLVGDTSVT
jgi:hypothetical protein